MTRKPNANNDVFLSAVQRERLRCLVTDEADQACLEIFEHYKVDLTANLRARFSDEALLQIWQRAGSEFMQKLELEHLQVKSQTQGKHNEQALISAQHVRECWREVVQNFYENNYWGLSSTSGQLVDLNQIPEGQLEKNELEKRQAQNRLREMWPYLWRFAFGLLFWKIAVMYFGLNGWFALGDG